MKIEFDEQTHIYKLNGKIIPSVTQILSNLSNFSFVSPEVLARKADIGCKVHKACEWWDKNELDEETLHPIISGYLSGWKKFKKDTRYIPMIWEVLAASEKYLFGGRIDSVGVIDDKQTLVDIKTGIKTKSHSLQTAAYQILWEEEVKGRIRQRLCVYLKKDGNYSIEPHSDKIDKYKFLEELRRYKNERVSGN